jgi:hypothetical protein
LKISLIAGDIAGKTPVSATAKQEGMIKSSFYKCLLWRKVWLSMVASMGFDLKMGCNPVPLERGGGKVSKIRQNA